MVNQHLDSERQSVSHMRAKEHKEDSPDQSATPLWCMAFLRAYALLPGSPHGRCLTGDQSRKADGGTDGSYRWAFCKSVFLFVEVSKGYGRGQRLLPRRWWCLRAEAPGLKQTGWSSVKSAGTETPPSRDYGPSDHGTPVIQKQAQ